MKLRRASRPLAVVARLGFLLLAFCPVAAHAGTTPKILSHPELAASRRQLIAERLREITGWRGLRFDESGTLLTGGAHEGGSPTARELLSAAVRGRDLIVLADASRRDDVVFCKVVEGRWTGDAEVKPPARIVLIDFADFSHVIGDREALAAFNVGWGLLHEISHVVNDADDADCEGEVGECEQLINRMRRECSLAERAEYHFKFLPGLERSEFKTRLVRLAFVRRAPASRESRVWLMWDASLVGGLRGR